MQYMLKETIYNFRSTNEICTVKNNCLCIWPQHVSERAFWMPEFGDSYPSTLRKMGWHSWVVARSRLQTRYRLVETAEERLKDHSEHRNGALSYWMFPRLEISLNNHKIEARGRTSHSPPGLIQTKASSYEFPVLVVGRTPKPVPFTLHQSPQAFCAVGWTPFRAVFPRQSILSFLES